MRGERGRFWQRTRRRGLATVAGLLVTAAVLVAAVSGAAATAVITIEVTASPSQVAAGSDVLLQAVITNTGTGTATHVVYRVQAPPGATVKQAGSPNGSCTVSPAEAVCSLANLLSGGVATADVLVTTPAADGPVVFDGISVTVAESDNDNPPNPGKTDTFYPSAPLVVGVRSDADFAGGCLEDGSLLMTGQGVGLSAANPVITTTQVVGTGGLCTPYTIEEVDDPPSSTIGCPPGAKCKMPQYVDVLFPDPEPGNPVTITVQTTAKTKTIYVDGTTEVPKCPRRGTITEGKCLLSTKALPGGGTEFTVLVASDIRLKG